MTQRSFSGHNSAASSSICSTLAPQVLEKDLLAGDPANEEEDVGETLDSNDEGQIDEEEGIFEGHVNEEDDLDEEGDDAEDHLLEGYEPSGNAVVAVDPLSTTSSIPREQRLEFFRSFASNLSVAQ